MGFYVLGSTKPTEKAGDSDSEFCFVFLSLCSVFSATKQRVALLAILSVFAEFSS